MLLGLFRFWRLERDTEGDTQTASGFASLLICKRFALLSLSIKPGHCLVANNCKPAPALEMFMLEGDLWAPSDSYAGCGLKAGIRLITKVRFHF